MDQADVHGDAALVAQLVAGEDAALDMLMQRYQEPIYFFILRYVHDEDLAYDLVQETFYRVYTKATSYKPRYRFSTWLYQIALNLCRDHERRQSLRRFFSLSSDEGMKKVTDTVYCDATVEKRYENGQDIARLQKEIAKLPPRLKAALILYSLEENSQAACSEILGISKKAVETRVYRARRILEQKMKKRFEGTD